MKMTLNVLRKKGKICKTQVYQDIDIVLDEQHNAYAFQDYLSPSRGAKCIGEMEHCSAQIHAVNIFITGMETLDGRGTFYLQEWNCTIPEAGHDTKM